MKSTTTLFDFLSSYAERPAIDPETCPAEMFVVPVVYSDHGTKFTRFVTELSYNHHGANLDSCLNVLPMVLPAGSLSEDVAIRMHWASRVRGNSKDDIRINSAFLDAMVRILDPDSPNPDIRVGIPWHIRLRPDSPVWERHSSAATGPEGDVVPHGADGDDIHGPGPAADTTDGPAESQRSATADDMDLVSEDSTASSNDIAREDTVPESRTVDLMVDTLDGDLEPDAARDIIAGRSCLVEIPLIGNPDSVMAAIKDHLGIRNVEGPLMLVIPHLQARRGWFFGGTGPFRSWFAIIEAMKALLATATNATVAEMNQRVAALAADENIDDVLQPFETPWTHIAEGLRLAIADVLVTHRPLDEPESEDTRLPATARYYWRPSGGSDHFGIPDASWYFMLSDGRTVAYQKSTLMQIISDDVPFVSSDELESMHLHSFKNRLLRQTIERDLLRASIRRHEMQVRLRHARSRYLAKHGSVTFEVPQSFRNDYQVLTADLKEFRELLAGLRAGLPWSQHHRLRTIAETLGVEPPTEAESPVPAPVPKTHVPTAAMIDEALKARMVLKKALEGIRAALVVPEVSNVQR